MNFDKIDDFTSKLSSIETLSQICKNPEERNSLNTIRSIVAKEFSQPEHYAQFHDFCELLKPLDNSNSISDPLLSKIRNAKIIDVTERLITSLFLEIYDSNKRKTNNLTSEMMDSKYSSIPNEFLLLKKRMEELDTVTTNKFPFDILKKNLQDIGPGGYFIKRDDSSYTGVFRLYYFNSQLNRIESLQIRPTQKGIETTVGSAKCFKNLEALLEWKKCSIPVDKQLVPHLLKKYCSCPITKQVMEDPVIDREGNNYERTALANWLETHNVSPLTGNSLTKEAVVSNRALKSAVEALKTGDETLLEESFKCPLSLSRMKEPAIDPEGHSYERQMIEQNLHYQEVSPLTRNPLNADDLMCNTPLKSLIQFLR